MFFPFRSVDRLEIEKIVYPVWRLGKDSDFASLLFWISVSRPVAAAAANRVAHERRRRLRLLLTHGGVHGKCSVDVSVFRKERDQ